MNSNKSFLDKLKNALNGLRIIAKETSIKIQLVIAIVMTIAGFYFKLSLTEWVLQVLTIAVILSIEGLNTAIEALADFIHPDHHKKIGAIKDVAAGAVFIVALAAIIIGLIIYLPKVL